MTTRNSKPSLLYTRGIYTSSLYTSGTPVRWLRAAAAILDQSLATLCQQQWRCAQLAVAETRNPQHLRRRLR